MLCPITRGLYHFSHKRSRPLVNSGNQKQHGQVVLIADDIARVEIGVKTVKGVVRHDFGCVYVNSAHVRNRIHLQTERKDKLYRQHQQYACHKQLGVEGAVI